MKIILTTSMSGLGGTENATFRLGRLLKQRGHDIVLASSDGPLIQEAQALGIRWQPIDFYQGGLLGYVKGMFAYMKLLKKEKPDVIHCQMARIVPACAIAAKFASPKTKVFYHARGLDPETYPKIAKLFDKLGVYIIGNCKHEREKLIRYGFPANRITYTYNALHKADFVPEKTVKDYVQLGTLSRLDTVRAVHLMLDILKKMVDRGMPVRLNVAGIGEEMDNLKAQAKRLGIEDKVTFLGGVRDLTGYFKEVDILVNTPHCVGDHGAGVGNNILEAGLYDIEPKIFDEALADTTLACALTSRRREITAPLQTPRDLVPELLQAANRGEKVALVFGNETFGLSIEEVQACNRLMTINGNPDYFSLNLAQAVQVVCYEIFSQTDSPMTHLQQEDHAATHEQIKGMVAHMESVMNDIGFFNRRNGERLMRRMQSLFGRANTQTEDIDILRGFFNTVSHRIHKKD